MGLNPVWAGVFIKKRNLDTEIDTHTGRTPREREANTGVRYLLRWYIFKKTLKMTTKAPEARSRFLLCPQKEPTLSTPWPWTSGLQNCETINPVYFVAAALGNWYMCEMVHLDSYQCESSWEPKGTWGPERPPTPAANTQGPQVGASTPLSSFRTQWFQFAGWEPLQIFWGKKKSPNGILMGMELHL